MPTAAREAIKKLIKRLNHFNRFLGRFILKSIVSTWQNACSPAQPRTGTERGKRVHGHGHAHPHTCCSTGQLMGNTRKCWLGSHQRATAPGRPEVSHRVPGQAVGSDCRGVLRSYCCRVTMAQYLMSLSMFPALLKLEWGLHGDSCPSPPPREYDNFFRNVSSPPSFFFGLR